MYKKCLPSFFLGLILVSPLWGEVPGPYEVAGSPDDLVERLAPAGISVPGVYSAAARRSASRRAPGAPFLRVSGQGALVQEWVRHYRRHRDHVEGPTVEIGAWVADVALHPDGGVVAAGFVEARGSSENSDGLVIRYRANGQVAWKGRFDRSEGDYYQTFEAVALDSEGNAVAVGSERPVGSFEDWAIAKFSHDGRLLWWRIRPSGDDGGYGNAVAEDVVVDGDGYIYVTGRSGSPLSSHSGYDLLVVKLDPDGEHLWTQRFRGEDDRWGEWRSHAVMDGAGELVVVSETPSPAGDVDWLVLKVGTDGAMRWYRRFGGKVGDDQPQGVAIDASGDIYVTGDRVKRQGDSDVMVAKFASGGRLRWKRTWNSRLGSGDGGQAIAVGPGGEVVAAGATWGGNFDDGGTQWDYVTVSYDANGKRNWVRTWVGEGPWPDYATDVHVGESGVFVTGRGYADRDGLAFTTLWYSNDGELIGIAASPSNLYSGGPFLAATGDELYVVGSDAEPGKSVHLTAVRYRIQP